MDADTAILAENLPDSDPPGRPESSTSLSARASRWRRRPSTTAFLPLPATALVVLGFVVPLLVVVLYSLRPTVAGQIADTFTLDNYVRFFTTDTYWQSMAATMGFIALASAITVALTFPLAYFVATKVSPRRRLLWVVVATIPLFTSYLIRVLAWLNLLGNGGLLNAALMRWGIVDSPVGLFEPGKPAVVITFAYLLFPLTFLTAFIALERVNAGLYEAASDLGAARWRRFLHVTLPSCRNGLVGGFILAFVSMLGDYVTPQLIGGTAGTFYANLMTNQFGNSMQWGFGSALALLLLVAIFALLAILRLTAGASAPMGAYTATYVKRRSPALAAYAWSMMAFLYLPIVVLVSFAFNDSTTVGLPFQGFTTEWFTSLFTDSSLHDALIISLKVALSATGVSLVLGTAAAIYLSRAIGTWRNLSMATISTPLFLPPVIFGLALIIGLNALDVDRGLWTIVMGHIIITLPIVTLVVMIRLEGVDRNLELAALDLGAKPVAVFLRVVLPQVAPGILAAAMISVATSMDEFIMTFLITGSDTTLPLFIYSSLRFGLSPELTALSTLILVASFVLILVGVLTAVGRRGLQIRSKPVGAA
ncbi:ABC transporter permease subunit [Mycobacterium yunnanensis]|uniref:ABC transporter permease subunit n=1 Tax=Mycobacterium yunnanensis TaxID=368477 RepID=A0A9X3BWJ4_9MYCO|nr:ABC transporter permease subunit [Mycobacterium yunnanensis]MCV7424729.1 ABC transporter permease subunit [Mycobacterium yunnanensis]